MKRFSAVAVFLLLALPLSGASAAMTLYSGEMELVAVSGGGCTERIGQVAVYRLI